MNLFQNSRVTFSMLEASPHERQQFWFAMGTSVIMEAIFVALILVAMVFVVAEPPKMAAYATVPLANPLTTIRIPLKGIATNSKPNFSPVKRAETSSHPLWVPRLASPIVTTTRTTRVAPREILQIKETPVLVASLRIPASAPRRPVELGVLSQSIETGDVASKIGRNVELGGLGSLNDGTGPGHRPSNKQIIPQGSFASLEPPERKTVQTPAPPSPAERPEILMKPMPRYTEDARVHKIEGDVLIAIRFQADGTVRVLEIKRGLGFGLDEEASRAAEQIKFRPALRAGTPVDFDGVVRIEFRLAY